MEVPVQQLSVRLDCSLLFHLTVLFPRVRAELLAVSEQGEGS